MYSKYKYAAGPKISRLVFWSFSEAGPRLWLMRSHRSAGHLYF